MSKTKIKASMFEDTMIRIETAVASPYSCYSVLCPSSDVRSTGANYTGR